MKSNKTFLLTEAVLGILVILAAVFMVLGENAGDSSKIAVIIEDSEDSQWSSFRYGLRMAAEDLGVELSVASTVGELTLEEAGKLIEQEIAAGADGIILQPLPGSTVKEMISRADHQVPVMLVESTETAEPADSDFPVTRPDNYALGQALAEEILADCGENIQGKALGIVSADPGSEAAASREQGFRERMKGTGARVSWSLTDLFREENALSHMAKADFIVALDDASFTLAGEYSAGNDLHGAIVYGIGNSTEAAYYLDTGAAECLIVPDFFNLGYKSLQELTKELRHFLGKMENQTISYTVIRKDTLFSKKNQELLLTMNQ